MKQFLNKYKIKLAGLGMLLLTLLEPSIAVLTVPFGLAAIFIEAGED